MQEIGSRERTEPAISTGEGPTSTETQETDQVLDMYTLDMIKTQSPVLYLCASTPPPLKVYRVAVKMFCKSQLHVAVDL